MVYPISKILLLPPYRLWLRKVQGMENIPEDKPFIIAANHSSYYDALLLHSILIPKLNKKIHALVHSGYWSNPINKYFLNLGECIPVHVGKKGSKHKNKKSIGQAIKYLKKKEIVQIFPEGTRSQDGKLKRAYNGIAVLALKAKVPVLPIGIIDSYKVLPRGKVFLRFKKCEVKIGKLMYFDDYYTKKSNQKTLDAITRSVMKQIAKLIGKKYNY